MKTISDTSVDTKRDTQNQTVKLEESGIIFKIAIHNESYSFQSHATLELLNKQGGWTILEHRNPQDDYKIAHTYNKVNSNHFESIIKDFKNLIKKEYAPILSNKEGFYTTMEQVK